MDSIHIAKVYADALLEISQEEGRLAEYEEELDAISKSIESEPDIWSFFLSPKVTKEQKLNVLESSLSGKVTERMLSFFSILIHHDRISILGEVLRQYSLGKDKILGRKRAYLYSAREMDRQKVDEIKLILDQKFSNECVLETRLKPELIGGFIIRFDDSVIDGSVKNHLAGMKKKLLLRKLQSGTLYED